MFHACVQKFDGMDEKFLSGEQDLRKKKLFLLDPFGSTARR